MLAEGMWSKRRRRSFIMDEAASSSLTLTRCERLATRCRGRKHGTISSLDLQTSSSLMGGGAVNRAATRGPVWWRAGLLAPSTAAPAISCVYMCDRTNVYKAPHPLRFWRWTLERGGWRKRRLFNPVSAHAAVSARSQVTERRHGNEINKIPFL